VLYGAMFVLGMILTHVVLGLIAGVGGRWVASLLGRSWGLVLGPLLIVLGLMWAGWLRIPLPSFGFRAKRPTAAWGAFLLGIPFAIAVCPVCTPALVVLLGVTAGRGSVLLGVVLLLAFALGARSRLRSEPLRLAGLKTCMACLLTGAALKSAAGSY
jgi:cytochrome c-type biogenesis protein